MTPKRAAEVLRITGDDWEQEEACLIGAEALELLQWQAETQAHVTFQSGFWRCSVGWFTSEAGQSPTDVLQKARAEWEKERGKG